MVLLLQKDYIYINKVLASLRAIRNFRNYRLTKPAIYAIFTP